MTERNHQSGSTSDHHQDAPPAFGIAQPLRARWRRRGLALGVALALLAVAIGAAFILWDRAGDDDGPATSLSIPGSLTLNGGAFTWVGGSDRACFGRGGYADIRGGTTVTVTAADGTVVALGQLASGSARVGSDGRALDCTFRFHVDDVPAGQGFYGVEVSHRGVLRYAEADIVSGREVDLTLG